MRTTERQETYKFITIKKCDKCGVNTEPESKYDGFSSDIELRVGDICGYGGEFLGDYYYLDLCEPCSKELFLEILPNLGYKINKD